MIHQYAEKLPGERGQLHRDVVIDGRLVPELSGPTGSPAPWATVKAHESTRVWYTVSMTNRPRKD